MTPPATVPNSLVQPTPDDGYREVFDLNPTPMWVFDLDTHRFLAVNAAAIAEYGYPPAQFLSLTIRDVYGEADLERFTDGLASGAQQLYTGHWVHRRADGTSLQVEVLSSDVLFQGHHARLVHVTNVTARRQAEAARRESEQLLGAIVESSHDAILSKTMDGTILTWNAAAEQMYGYSPEEAIGGSVYRIVPPDLHEDLAMSLQAVCKGSRLPPYETTRVHKDGRRIFVSVAISPIVNRAGVVVGFSSIARDITHRKAMEDQLQQAQKLEAIGSLAGGIAHDFNNLLTVILGNAGLAFDEIDPSSPARADIEEISMAARSAALLTRQLLTFSQKSIVQDAVVDLNDIIQRLDPILRRTLGEDIEFSVRRQPGLWGVRADEGQLEQVVMNLVVNARRAMLDGGALTVETANVHLDESFVAAHEGAAAGAFVRLSVTDTGCGMTPEVRARIFEPFYTTKGPTKGTGLGLSTVLGIVQQAAGFISVDSEPEAGSTFTVYFPQTVDDRAPMALGAALPVGTGTETILLVEDDHGIRVLGARGLRRYGYTLLLARHAPDALRIAEGHPGKIDLLLTDIVMPGGNGRTLAEQLVRSVKGLKVLYTSGYTDSVATIQAIRASAAEFIQKPYSADALARKVRRVLDADTRPALPCLASKSTP
jgi:two-component system cell cycle sensor histidine kinase/response regulator CckA